MSRETPETPPHWKHLFASAQERIDRGEVVEKVVVMRAPVDADRYRVHLPSGRAEEIRRALALGLRAPLNAAPVNHAMPVSSGLMSEDEMLRQLGLEPNTGWRVSLLPTDEERAAIRERAIERYGFWLGAAAEDCA